MPTELALLMCIVDINFLFNAHRTSFSKQKTYREKRAKSYTLAYKIGQGKSEKENFKNIQICVKIG